jgi:hypothetical protein
MPPKQLIPVKPIKQINALIKDINESINTILTHQIWSVQQHNTYKMLQTYVNNYKLNDKKYELRDDIEIIRSNLLSQFWYQKCNIKSALTFLFDSMMLSDYYFTDNKQCINLNLTIEFDKFSLNVSYYNNKINNCTNFYVFFENNNTKNRAYLCYYGYALKNVPSNDLVKLKIPEFSKIYTVTDINSDILKQFDLLCFFSELIFYYDESGKVGDCQISYSSDKSLNQLIENYTKFLLKQ